MRLLHLIGLLLAFPLLLGAAEPKLVPDVSQREIQIRYSFTGAELLLFGAVLYPAAGADRPRRYRGGSEGPDATDPRPGEQKVAGIWMNVESERFRSAPSFYAVASSRPLPELVDDRTAAIYELVRPESAAFPGCRSTPQERQRFEAG
jgi:hypothetical protein